MKTVHSSTRWTDMAGGLVMAATRVGAFLVLLALGAHLARAGESAKPNGPTAQTAVVSMADLDLTTEAGMRVARERLHATARRLCRRVVDPWALSHQPDYVACVDAALASALGQLPSPAVAANSTAH
ncbi:MAG: UrcA family protein [Steroidobacteraceae bacterium]|jgi:UrcA family protein